MRLRTMCAAALVLVACLLLACSGDDDGAGDGTPDGTADSTPTPVGTVSETPKAEDARACRLLGMADVEAVTGDIISVQEGIPDDFESCYEFTGGGEVILEVCECLTSEEFDQEIVDDARGRGTTSEAVPMLGDSAAWVLAGDNQPNTGILWVKSGDTILTLWLDVPTYRDPAVAQADTEMLMRQILAGLP